jgi:hypothetical protein
MKRLTLRLGIVASSSLLSLLVGHSCFADFILLRGDVVCIDCDLKAEHTGTQSWGAIQQGFQTSVYISNKVYAAGEDILASVALRNTLDHAIPFGLPNVPIFGLTITDPDGRSAALTDYGRRQAGGTFTSVFSERLSSQGILKMQYPLEKLFDMTKPGKYVVTARYCIPKSNDTNSVCAISNTVTVEVAAASSGGSISR